MESRGLSIRWVTLQGHHVGAPAGLLLHSCQLDTTYIRAVILGCSMAWKPTTISEVFRERTFFLIQRPGFNLFEANACGTFMHSNGVRLAAFAGDERRQCGGGSIVANILVALGIQAATSALAARESQ